VRVRQRGRQTDIEGDRQRERETDREMTWQMSNKEGKRKIYEWYIKKAPAVQREAEELCLRLVAHGLTSPSEEVGLVWTELDHSVDQDGFWKLSP
jgi:hypothetical protein